jgi:hypothetical protein
MNKELKKINLQIFAGEEDNNNKKNETENEDNKQQVEIKDNKIEKDTNNNINEELEKLKRQNEELMGLLKALKSENKKEDNQDKAKDEQAKAENDPVAEYLKTLEKQKEEEEKRRIKEIEEENKRLKLKSVIDATIENKPHLKKFLLDKWENGIIKNIEDVKFYSSKEFDEMALIKSRFEDEAKKRGQNPDDFIRGTILNNDIAEQLEQKKAREEYMKKLSKKLNLKKIN